MTIEQELSISHLVRTPGIVGGKPRIEGTRITVQNIVIWYDRLGLSADEIAAEYDLTLGQIFAALAYYHDHVSEIQASIKSDREFVEQMKKERPSLLAKMR